MGIAAIFVDRYNRRSVRDQILALERLSQPLLDLELARAAASCSSANLRENFGHDGVN